MSNPSIKKNFIYNLFFQLISVIIPLITAPYLSRVLGAEGIGIHSYTSSVESYFAMVAALGTSTYGARVISQHRDDKKTYSRLFWEIEFMTVITTGVMIVLWCVFSLLNNEYQIYYLILNINLVAIMFDISWLFTGLEQFGKIVARNTLFKLVGVVCTFIFVKDANDLGIYMIIYYGSVLCSNVSMWLYLPKVLDKVGRLKSIHLKKHLRETIVYFLPSVASSFYLIFDKVLLEVITNDILENGYYAQADKILSLCKSVVFTALNAVVGVRISYLFTQEKYDEIHRRIEYSMNYIMFMGLGCVFGVIGIAKRFVPFFFGEGYDKVVLLLSLYIIVLIPTAISTCMSTHYYTPVGRRAECIKYIVCGAIVNVILNLLLIPNYKSIGAVAATIIAECLITMLYIKHSDGYMKFKILIKTGYKKLISAIVMYLLVTLISENSSFSDIMTLVIQIMSGVAVYCLSLLILRDEWFWSVLNSVFKSRKRIVS